MKKSTEKYKSNKKRSLGLNKSQASAYIKPDCHGKRTEQSGSHNDTGGKISIVIHVLCHDIAAYSCGRTQHDNDRYQHIMGKAKHHAIGRNTASYPASFKKVQAISGFGLANALPNFNAPPMAISPRGVACFPRLFTEVSRIAGIGKCSMTISYRSEFRG